MPRTSSDFDVMDLFCGAGGSSAGATRAGAKVRLAMNHNPLALESHNTNFPHADHVLTDISTDDPRRYRTTTMLIASPECTNHALAKGKKRKHLTQLQLFEDAEPLTTADEEKSRATMMDVVRFTAYHKYQFVIVENVVDVRFWSEWDNWILQMHNLGYEHKEVYLNSQFIWPTPQSRDRIYVVFWLKGNPKPDLDIRPLAYCMHCAAQISSVQSWKKPARPFGKYRQQYIYCCPNCGQQVEPFYFAALNAIDWGLPITRIGDRKRPLKDSTRERLRIGLDRLGMRAGLVETKYSNSRNRRARGLEEPLPTQSGQQTHGMYVPPFLVDVTRTKGIPTSLTAAHPTLTSSEVWGVAMPPHILDLAHANLNQPQSVEATFPTQTTAQSQGLLVPPMLVSLNHSTVRATGIDSPFPTVMPEVSGPALTVPAPFMVDLRGHNVPYALMDALSTICSSGNHHGLVIPFVHSYYHNDTGTPVSDAIGTVTPHERHALVVPPSFILSYYNRLTGKGAAESGVEAPLPTVPGRAVHYLVEGGPQIDIDDCGFRMLHPSEIHRAMAFPDGYVVLGNQRQQVQQFGQAVTPPVMEELVRRCYATLV